MAYTIKLLREAEKDLASAFEWYEEKQQGLGKRLQREMGACITRIRKNPYLFQARFKEVFRFAPLKIFPYLIVNKINENKGEIIVNAIFHCSRNPEIFE